MKRRRVLFIQRGTEEIPEDQGQKPEECYHSGLARGLGVHKRPEDEGAETQRAKEGSISRQERAHVTRCQSSQARAKGLDWANHKETQVPFAQDISEE